jgi:hypothetical protein
MPDMPEELNATMLFDTEYEAEEQKTAPPEDALFPVIVLFVIVGEEAEPQYIPLPLVEQFPVIVLFKIVGDEV